MRIALDAHNLLASSPAPACAEGATVASLYRELGAIRPQWELHAYHREAELAGGADARPFTARYLRPMTAQGSTWSQLQFPFAAWRHGSDVIVRHGLDAAPLSPVPTVLFVHHVNPVESPRGLTVSEVDRFERRLRRACKRATRIICPTEHVRETLIKEFAVAPAKIAVVPLGPDESVRHVQPGKWRDVLQRYDLSRPFVMHYGPDEPRRNTRRLIEAWAMTDLKVRQRVQLAIVGMSGQTGEELERVVNRLGLAASVKLYRSLGEPADLSALLSAADIAALPYSAAGFPRQMLDAWATKAAVITGDCGSMKEVAGNAAALVDPNDAGAIARAISRLVRDARYRHELIALGQQRLEQFTWRAAAERFAGVIEEVAGVEAPMRRAA